MTTEKLLAVGDIGSSMQRFGWVDYVTFIGMLGISLVVGIYFGVCKKSETAQDYLVASRSMGIIPIAMSLLASSVSGISLLGIPTEVYVYGIQYNYILGGFVIASILMGYIFLPVFQGLQLTSTYEYHERRFSKGVRLFGSLLFSIKMLSWLPLVIYVPALALNQGKEVFSLIYGGLKGVVWTDVIQLILMFAALILVVIKGTLDVGGFGNVFKRNWDSDRIEGPNFDLDPLSRHTIWTLVIGGTFLAVQTSGVNQNMIQRYLSLPSLKHSRSSLSTGLNAMAAIVLEDFYKPFINRNISEKQSFYLMKSTVIITGAVCIGLVFLVEKMGTVLQLSMSIGSIGNGPSLGVSAMGILLPWINSKGALSGGIISLVFMTWYCLKTQSLIASGGLKFEEKPVSTEGCHYHFTPTVIKLNNITHTDEQYMIYRLSYLYYCMIGTFVAMFVGLIVSALTTPNDPRDVDPQLLAPFVRKLIKPRKYSNQPYDGITYAYGSPINGMDNEKKEIMEDKV
uniref:Sodium-coupled monocarboxylate transporter 1-like n=1 Tax=Diabrotica virgifera virgifera TaxID=50390 RepID=A0A6P7EZC1_DIAVI